MTAYTERSFNNPDLAQFVDAILARQRELRNEGIDEREIDRVLVAEFSSGQNYVDDWAPTNNDPTYPALTDGQATTLYPPIVLPQELDIAGPFDNDGFDHKNPDPGYAGGRDVYNLDQYKTNAPENKVIKSSSLVNDPVLGALGSKVDSQTPTIGTTGYNSDMAIPPWRYHIEDNQMREAWVEGKHPRDADGQWSSTEGGNGSSSQAKVVKSKVVPDYQKIVDGAENVWNNIPDDMKVGVETFNIGDVPEGLAGFTSPVGTWDNKTKTLGVHINNSSLTPDSTPEQIREQFGTILTHEVSHAKFDSYTQAQRDSWTDKVSDLPGITGYLEKFKETMVEAERKYDDSAKRINTMFDAIEEAEAKLKSGLKPNGDPLSDVDKIEIEIGIESDNKTLDRFRKERDEEYVKYRQTKMVYADETHSEYNVINQGYQSFYEVKPESYEAVDEVFNKMFRGNNE